MCIFKEYLKLAVFAISIIAAPAAFASAEELAVAPKSTARYHSEMKAEFESFLIQSGQQLLCQLYADEQIDLKNSTVFADMMKHLEPVKEDLKYSKLADYAFVSNGLRWCFTNTDQTYVTTRQNHLTAILAMCWALTQQADDQKDPFARGSFTLVDPGHKFYNFLLDYVKLVTQTENPQALAFEMTVSNFAYQRDPKKKQTSHHVNRSPESQFGIDMRLAPHEGVLKVLPHQHSHILFGKLDVDGQETPLTFLKLEEIGMGSKGAILMHGINFQRSAAYLDDSTRREKDIRPEISASFEALEALARQNQVAMPEHKKTIRSMFQIAQQLAASETPVAAAAQDFLGKLDSTYTAKNHDLRVGNEVIIDLPSVLRSN
jgi:hypothetical protein